MVSHKSLLLLAITFSVVISLVNVKAHYVPEDGTSSEETSDEDRSKFSQFFEDVKCGINHGAKKIKEGATTAYNYLKSKIAPGSNASPAEFPANVTEIFINDDKTPLAPMPSIPPIPVKPSTNVPVNTAPVTFPAVPATARDLPIWDIDVRSFINDTDDKFPQVPSSTPEISLDDRALFDVPGFCPDGEMKDRSGRCRKIS